MIIQGIIASISSSTGPSVLSGSVVSLMSGDSVTDPISFTAEPYTVIVVASGSETNNTTPALITDITGMELTWIQRAVYTDPDSNCGQTAEIWYAINNTGSTISGTITITFDNNVDDQSTVISYYKNCNLTTPWTSSGPSYSNSKNDVHATVTMNIAESNTIGIVFFAIPNYGTDTGYGSVPGYAQGWKNVNYIQNGGNTNWEYVNMSYREFSTPQTNLVVNSSGDITWTDNNAIGLTTIADALVHV
jgi:hypothetical protein